MGFMACTPWNWKKRGVIADAYEVCEPAGFEGEWVTIAASLADVKKHYRGEPLKIGRQGRTIYASRQEAKNEARAMIERGRQA